MYLMYILPNYHSYQFMYLYSMIVTMILHPIFVSLTYIFFIFSIYLVFICLKFIYIVFINLIFIYLILIYIAFITLISIYS